jgi:(hydroxyamino)benzene mutase
MTSTATPSRTAAEGGLVWHGLVLFFLGLLTGFVIPAVKSPRLGVSAHVEAVLNGMFLVVMGGIVWNRLRLSARMAVVLYWQLLFAAYGCWFFCLLAAVFGASRMLPIAGAGYQALPWQERLVTGGLGVVAVDTAVACAVVLYGLHQAKHMR